MCEVSLNTYIVQYTPWVGGDRCGYAHGSECVYRSGLHTVVD